MGDATPSPATTEQPQTGASPTRSLKLPDGFISVSVISTVLLFAVLFIKIYGVAHYNVNIVVALASTSPTAVILGTIGVYSYIFTAVIAVALGCLFVASWNKSYPGYAPFRLILFIGTLFLLMLTPWHYFIDSAVLAAVLTVLQWIGSKLPPWSGRLSFHFIKACMTSIMVIFMLFILITLDQPWLPAEVVTLNHRIITNQTEPLKSKTLRPVAFVLSEDNGQVELLIDDDRTIVYVPADDVVSREICNLNDNPMGSVPTDQPDEHAKMNAPLPIRLLEWCPRKQYPHPANKKAAGCF